MAILLSVNLLCSATMLGLSLYRSAPECAAQFYPATIPTMVQAGLAAAVALAGFFAARRRRLCVLLSSAALALLGIPAMYATTQWPGGDDGGGLGWLFVVGGGCVASLAIGWMTAVIGLSRDGQRRPSRGRSA